MKKIDLIKNYLNSNFEKLDDFIDRLKNSIKFNGFYILLSMCFPLLLLAMGAGAEIFLILLNKSQFFSNILIDFSFFTLSYCLWIVPALSIYLFRTSIFGENNTVKDEEKAFKKLAHIYNGIENTALTKKQIAIRYLATFPFLLFVMGLFYNGVDAGILNNVATITGIDLKVVNTIAIILIFLVYPIVFYAGSEFIVKQIYRKRNIKLKLILIYIFTVLLYTLTIHFKNNSSFNLSNFFDKNIDIDPYLLSISHSFAFFFSYFFLRSFELNPNKISIKEVYSSAKKKHLFLLIYLTVILIVFSFMNSSGVLGILSPIVVGIFLISFLIIMIEAFISAPSLLINLFPVNQKNSLKIMSLKFLLFVIVGLFVYNFFSNFNRHDIRTIEKSHAEYRRQDMETYFSKWVADKSIGKQDGDTLTVYLVSGQGGGSRAGAWFLLNMLNFDAKDSTFYKNTFSLSTVSGSTSGANMFLAIQNLKQRFKKDSTLTRKLLPFEITKSIYSKNFVNGALFGVLISDLFEGYDRNSTLQLEEKKALQNYFDDGNSADKLQVINDFFENDYMDQYKNQSTKTPLFFINSTVASTGIKAIFSPVKDDSVKTNNISTIFSAIDLYANFKNFKNKKRNYILPMVTCVNQSQAFPLANSYNYLDSVGRLCDGGAIENTGIGTSTEVYKKLVQYREKIEARSGIKIKFVFLNILNSKIFEPATAKFANSSLTDVFTEITNSVFNASQPTAVRNQFIAKLPFQNDKIIVIPLKEEVALTRVLSDKTIARMYKTMDSIKLNSAYRKKTELKDLPLVYIQASSKNSSNLTKLTSVINYSRQYNIKPVEILKGLKIKENQIRYFNLEDKEIADQLQKTIGRTMGNVFVVKDFSDTNDGSRVPLKQVEVWIASK